MKMKELLYVPALKKNLLSISTLYNKGYRVDFIDGQVLMWSKGNKIEDVWLLVKKKEDYTNSREIQRQPFSMRPLAHVKYGIEGFLISNTKYYPM